MSKIKVAAVSYLNTKPLLYGIERSKIREEMDLLLDYPSILAEQLSSGKIDIALLPVAAIPNIPNAKVVSDYGIAADGIVASVSVFSQVPLEEIEILYLDYQSRTSVRLAELLFERYWKQDVVFKAATENYIDCIKGTEAGVIIGDRALKQEGKFEFVYDLSEAWKQYTGLPFVFAAWVSNKELPATFLEEFNKANALGLSHIDELVKTIDFPYYDLTKYYMENIHYYLSDDKKKGLYHFLNLIQA